MNSAALTIFCSHKHSIWIDPPRSSQERLGDLVSKACQYACAKCNYELAWSDWPAKPGMAWRCDGCRYKPTVIHECRWFCRSCDVDYCRICKPRLEQAVSQRSQVSIRDPSQASPMYVHVVAPSPGTPPRGTNEAQPNSWSVHDLFGATSAQHTLKPPQCLCNEKTPAQSLVVTVSTPAGQTCQLSGLTLNDLFSSLRSRAASELGWPDNAFCIWLETTKLSAKHNVQTLRELGIKDGVVLTCVPQSGVVLGQRRYALTEKAFSASEDLSVAVCAEYDQCASVADFADLKAVGEELSVFFDKVGLYGDTGGHMCAFVRDKGMRHPWMTLHGGDGHFFVCRRSGIVPRDWLVNQGEDSDDDGEKLIKTQTWSNFDLCFKTGCVMPVLVDLGPA